MSGPKKLDGVRESTSAEICIQWEGQFAVLKIKPHLPLKHRLHLIRRSRWSD